MRWQAISARVCCPRSTIISASIIRPASIRSFISALWAAVARSECSTLHLFCSSDRVRSASVRAARSLSTHASWYRVCTSCSSRSRTSAGFCCPGREASRVRARNTLRRHSSVSDHLALSASISPSACCAHAAQRGLALAPLSARPASRRAAASRASRSSDARFGPQRARSVLTALASAGALLLSCPSAVSTSMTVPCGTAAGQYQAAGSSTRRSACPAPSTCVSCHRHIALHRASQPSSSTSSTRSQDLTASLLLASSCWGLPSGCWGRHAKSIHIYSSSGLRLMAPAR
mmetsp:Transcript_33802/g.74916  ORF Transcript_33802/g.74916 Transcript_33802/m.74916 type:complete len:290 (-) Transcript_33802:607-1476(-)